MWVIFQKMTPFVAYVASTEWTVVKNELKRMYADLDMTLFNAINRNFSGVNKVNLLMPCFRFEIRNCRNGIGHDDSGGSSSFSSSSFLEGPSAYASGSASALWLIVLPRIGH
jgi:hypothetical protein